LKTSVSLVYMYRIHTDQLHTSSSNFLKVLLLVIAWTKLDNESNKVFAPPSHGST
jgi:hypothetical protein